MTNYIYLTRNDEDNYIVSHNRLKSTGTVLRVPCHGIPKLTVDLLFDKDNYPKYAAFEEEFKIPAKAEEYWLTLPIDFPNDFEKGWSILVKELPELILTGLQLLTYSQLVWLNEICSTDKHDHLFGKESCVQIKWYEEATYITLDIHKNGNLHVTTDNRSSWRLNTQGGISSVISRLEIAYQIKAKLAVWCSEAETELGYLPNYEEDRVLVPISVQRIKRLKQPIRRETLENLYKAFSWFDLDHSFQLTIDELKEIWYGCSGFKLTCLLEAEKGNPDGITAAKALGLI